MWYQVKVSYERQEDVEGVKRVKEAYIVDALSVTEAETRIIKEIKPYVAFGELEVKDVTRYNVSEIIIDPDLDADTYYKARVAFLSLDEKTSAVKRDMHTYLVKSGSVSDALEGLIGNLNKTLGDYRVTSITETPIMDVYKYEGEVAV